MSDPQTIADARRLRDEALGIVLSDVQLVKLEASPARMKQRALDEAGTMLGNARDVAAESKGVIAATVLALGGWFLREPLLRMVGRLANRFTGGANDGDDDA